MNVGFIGLGLMGGSMALNLQAAGHSLCVHDLRRESAAPHLAKGAVWKDSPRALAEACDVVFTSLPGPPEVSAVAAGADGLIHGMRRGSALFDLSTNSPAVIRRLHAQFKDRGVEVLDAPVSGGPSGAKSRKDEKRPKLRLVYSGEPPPPPKPKPLPFPVRPDLYPK